MLTKEQIKIKMSEIVKEKINEGLHNMESYKKTNFLNSKMKKLYS